MGPRGSPRSPRPVECPIESHRSKDLQLPRTSANISAQASVERQSVNTWVSSEFDTGDSINRDSVVQILGRETHSDSVSAFERHASSMSCIDEDEALGTSVCQVASKKMSMQSSLRSSGTPVQGKKKVSIAVEAPMNEAMNALPGAA